MMLRLIYRFLDILIAIPSLIYFFLWAGLTYLDTNYLRRRRKSKRLRILSFTTSSSPSSFRERDLLHNIIQEEEDGRVESHYVIYPFKATSQPIKLSDRTTLIEWGTERFAWWKNRRLKYSRTALIAWDFFHYCVRLIKDEEINIIRSSNPFASALVAYICSRLARIPFCVGVRQEFDLIAKYKEVRELPRILGSRKLAISVQRIVLSRADRVIPTNESRAQYAIRHGAKPERIRIVPFHIDPAEFPERNPLLKKELGIEGKKTVSFVGRLVKDNYVYDVVHIAVEICQQRNDTVFLISGDGVERKSLEELSSSLGLGDSVRFLGMQKWHKAMGIRLISDVSLGLKAGNSLVEAAVAGSPLIAYDVDWHYELVKNGETGFLVPERDIEGVAQSILKLLDKPNIAKKFGENARKLAIERHGIENIRKIRLDIYSELLNVN